MFPGMASATIAYVCDLLSLSVICLCIVLKLPQILSIWRSKNTRGISLTSVLLEELGYTLLLTYQIAMGYPIQGFFEFFLLVSQDLVMITLILHYSGRLKMKVLPLYALYFLVSAMFAYRYVPDVMLKIAVNISTPISVSSKLMQLTTILRNRDAGQVSPVTWGLATYTASCRTFTTAMITGDLNILISFGLSALLNASLFLSILYYRNAAKPKRN